MHVYLGFAQFKLFITYKLRRCMEEEEEEEKKKSVGMHLSIILSIL